MGSLTEGLNLENTGNKKKGAAANKGTDMEKVKLFVAVGCLVVAGVIMAWYLGMFETQEKATPQQVQEQQQAVEQQKRQVNDEQQKLQNLPPSQRPINVGAN